MSEDKISSFINDLVRDVIGTVKDMAKDYLKVKALSEMFSDRKETWRFKNPEEKEIVIYTSQYCSVCEELLSSPQLAYIVKKAREKGFTVTIVHLDEAEEIEKALNSGIEDVPYARAKYKGKTYSMGIPELPNFLESVENG